MSQINKFAPTAAGRGTDHYCEYCGVWMKNHPRVVGLHEQGEPHKAAVSKKLHELRVKAEKDKADEASLKKSMAKIEADAKAKFEADKAAAAAAQRALGTWEPDESGYFYNEIQRYYYNKANGMYYGGEPAAWTTAPAIPDAARFEHSAAARAAAARAAGGAGPSSTAPPGAVKKRIAAVAHPLAGVGGFSVPLSGTAGAARGVGDAGVGTKRAKPAPGGGGGGGGGAGKAGGKPLSEEEKAAIERREAARKRVAQRSAAYFGM